jgi:phospholipid/cholesterol/gamma-HCH transport system substrate-binding protein
MPGTVTHFKLGLLAIVALVALFVVALGLGFRATRAKTLTYHTYVDESVQGLDVGAPVKYRGVRVGSVKSFGIAPDRRLVDIELSIDEHAVTQLGLATVAPGLRAQLRTQGITGVKIVDIDFFDPRTSPPPVLSFTPAPRYIPAQPSLFKDLEEQVRIAARQLSAMAERTGGTLAKIDGILDDVRGEHLAQRVGRVVDDMGGAVSRFRRLEQRTAPSIDKVASVLDQLDGEHGLIASARRATESFGDLGRTSTGATRSLQDTLQELGDAAQSVRDFFEALEREPDMLLKGRSERGRRSEDRK